MGKIEVYRDAKQEWRWRFLASNGRNMANSGEGYTSNADIHSAIRTLKSEFGGADVSEK